MHVCGFRTQIQICIINTILIVIMSFQTLICDQIHDTSFININIHYISGKYARQYYSGLGKRKNLHILVQMFPLA